MFTTAKFYQERITKNIAINLRLKLSRVNYKRYKNKCVTPYQTPQILSTAMGRIPSR